MPAEVPESHQVNAPTMAVPVPPQETPQALLDKVSEGLANLESPTAPTDGAGTPAESQPESYSDAASKGMVPALVSRAARPCNAIPPQASAGLIFITQPRAGIGRVGIYALGQAGEGGRQPRGGS